MNRAIQCIIFSFLFFITACSSSSNKTFTIGVDPDFYSIEAIGREKNIMGFATDLMSEVSQHTKLSIHLKPVNWNTLFAGMQKKQYQAVFSGMPPYNFTEELYSFSPIFLKTGPVLVVPTKSFYKSLSDLGNREVGIISDSKNIALLEKNPSIIIRPYDSIPKMLNDVSLGILEAAFIGILPAEAYCNDLYQGTLKIVTGPLNEDGLRLITLKGDQQMLMKAFDNTISKMQSDGSYVKLMQKWGLSS